MEFLPPLEADADVDPVASPSGTSTDEQSLGRRVLTENLSLLIAAALLGIGAVAMFIPVLGGSDPAVVSYAGVSTVGSESVAVESQAVAAPAIRRPSTTSSGELLLSETAETMAVAEPATVAQKRGAAALARISYPWQDRLQGWTIVFTQPRDGLYGLTFVDKKRIEIYVRDGQDADLLAHIVAHEIGHALDVSMNNGPSRRIWQDARSISGSPWWPDEAASDFATGAGDFAESFAAWQVSSKNFRSELAGPPTASQQELLAQIVNG